MLIFLYLCTVKRFALVIGLLLPLCAWATPHLPDSVWTVLQKDGHHHEEANEIWLSADRPGVGSEVLDRGYIQWETGFEVAHFMATHFVTLPTTLFRFGVHKRVEMRLEYNGWLMLSDHPDSDPTSADAALYAPSWLWVGSKFQLWQHHGGSLDQKWIPRAALLLNLGLPTTTVLAEDMPIAGIVDLAFENEVLEWLSLSYNLSVQWVEWAPAPDILPSLAINFMPTDHLGLFVESFAMFDCDAVRPDGSTYTHSDVNFDLGLTYAVHPRVQLDIYGGFNLYNSSPALSGPKQSSFLGFGVTWLIWHPQK